MYTISRAAGAGLLVYGLGRAVSFAVSDAPGGDYEPQQIAAYVSPGHWPIAFAAAYLAAFTGMGLLIVGHTLRGLGGTVGEMLWGLGVAGTATGVVGSFVVGGVDVAMVEGGHHVQTGVSLPLVYTLSEIGGLLEMCAPALFGGVMALILAVRTGMPMWMRVFSVLAGVCGILAPLYFTYFVFLLWTIVLGARLLARREVAPAPAEPMVPAS